MKKPQLDKVLPALRVTRDMHQTIFTEAARLHVRPSDLQRVIFGLGLKHYQARAARDKQTK